MKSVISILSLLLTTLICFGQGQSNKVKVTQGPIFKEAKRISMNEIIGCDEQHCYGLLIKAKLGSAEYGLASFSKGMELETMAELDLSVEGKNLVFEKMILNDEGLFLFSSFRNDELKKRVIFVQAIDKKTLSPKKDIQKLAEIDFESGKEARSSNFSVTTSRDDSKVMVYYNTPYKKGEPEEYGIHVYDSSFEELWSQQVKLPYNDDLFELERTHISNDGEAHVIGKVLLEKKDRKRKDPDGNFVIIGYNGTEADQKIYQVDLGNNFVNTMMVGSTDNNELLCGGFYRGSNKSGSTGAFFVKIDRTSRTMTHQSLQEFNAEFVAQDLKKGAAKKALKADEGSRNAGVPSLLSQELIPREDGGLVLVGEQYYLVTTTTSNGQGGQTTRTSYHYDDIIVVNIDPSGNIEWTEKVPKRQASGADGYFLSYTSMVKDDKVYFVFNDNPKNLAYKGDGKWKALSLKDAELMLVEIDGDGRVFRESMLGKSGANVIARPKVSAQIDEKNLIIYAERKKDKGLMNVEFVK